MTKRLRKGILTFDRILSSNLWKQGLVLLIMMVLAFVLSYAMLSFSGAEWEKFCDANKMSKWSLPLYLLIDTNALNTLYIFDAGKDVDVQGWMLFVSGFTYLLGVFLFSGMIISLITNSISRRVDDHRGGRVFYLLSGHYVIMGYDDMVPAIIFDIFKRDKDAYVLILTAVNAEKIREWLAKSVASKLMERIIVNYGHRTMKECYPKIHLEAAKEIFIVGRRNIETHDAMNVENVDSICSYLSELKKEKGDSITLPQRIICVFEDLDTYTAFKTTEIFDEVNQLGISFMPYNFYTGWAKQVFVKGNYIDKQDSGNPISYPAMLREKGDEERYAHLVFVGITTCSVAMSIEAANVLHFPLRKDEKMRKTRITFIDKNADQEMAQFVTRYRHFFDVEPPLYEDLSDDNGCGIKRLGDEGFLDTEFHFIKGDAFSKKVQDELCKYATDKNQSLTIFIAMRNPKDNFTFGMNMPDTIYQTDTPLFIRQDRSDNFVTNLRCQDSYNEKIYRYVENGALIEVKRKGRFANIYPFGMIDTGFSRDNVSLQRAKLINLLYTIGGNHDGLTNTVIMAKAEELWVDRKVADRWSSLYSAYSINIKLDTLRRMRGLEHTDLSADRQELTDKEVDALAVVEHNRWNVEKLLMGFRTPTENEDKYLHKEFSEKLVQNKYVFIHHHIKPYKLIDSQVNDCMITRNIPWILRMTEHRENEETN